MCFCYLRTNPLYHHRLGILFPGAAMLNCHVSTVTQNTQTNWLQRRCFLFFASFATTIGSLAGERERLTQSQFVAS